MNAEEIINFNKKLYTLVLTSSDKSSRFFNKSILHYAATMEIFSFIRQVVFRMKNCV